MEAKKTKKADLESKRGIFMEVGLVTVLGILFLAFNWTTRPSQGQDFLSQDNVEIEEEIIPITEQKQEVAPPPEPPKVTEILEIVEDDVELDDDLDISSEADENLAVEIVEYEEEEEAEEEEVFVIVEDMPKFQGGDKDLFRTWIGQNLKYPEIAAENGIQGKVYVQFAINNKGYIVDVKVVRGVDPALDAEAVRVVKSSPKWEPGKQRGKPVKVQFTFPINFVLN